LAQIKKDTSLRKAILQAAITGQLISNVEGTTETGKEILDKIIEERNKKLLAEWEEALKKNPKAKKPAPVVASEIDEEEIPFEIPENWCWCRLKDIFFMQAGKTISSSKIFEIRSNENPYPCFGGNGLRGYVSNYNKEGSYPIIGRQGALCGCINIATGKFYATEHAVVVDCFDICNYQWASWFLIALNLNQYATATAQPGLAVNKIETVLIPLPPLAVQNAIVAKLEQVLLLADAYENAILQKEELKSALPDKVKKAILQEAITGKLTEAWRKSATIKESGKQLLDRIIEERNAKALAEWEEALKKNPKAKKPVIIVASEIEEEDIPFEVPESWCWCRLGDIVDTNIGLTYSPSDITKNEGIAVLRSNNIKDGKIVYDDLVYVNKEVSVRCLANKGDLLICARNGSRALVGKCALIEKDGMAFGAFMAIIRSDFNPYILHFINSPIYRERLDGVNTTTINQITQNNLCETLIPLPPLEEQEEIVKKVEELLPLCK
jgi:type I restriction enzyme S subunit